MEQMEHLLGLPLLFRMFPLYYFLKSAVIVWLMAPAFQGAKWIWNSAMHLTLPLIKKHIAAHFRHPEKKPAAPSPPPPPKTVVVPKKSSFIDIGKISYSR